MNDLSLKELFDLYQRQSDSIHKLWAYFQVVSFAVLGYVFGSNKIGWGESVYFLIGFSYACFGFVNQWVIVISQRELMAFSKAVKVAAMMSGEIGKTLGVKAIDARVVAVMHSSAMAVVLFAILLAWSARA